MIIDKKSILSPPLEVILFIISFFLNEIIIDNLNLKLYFSLVLKAPIILLFFSVIDLSKIVKLENETIKKGLYFKFWGFLKIEKEILLKDIIEITIFQNDKNYFEITAITKADKLILKKNPNKKPAEEELRKLVSLLKITQ